MKRKLLAFTMVLTLLISLLAVGGMSVAASDDDLYVTKASIMTNKVNHLKDKTPTSGWGADLGDSNANLLTNGVYSKTATDGWQAPFSAGSRLVYDLGGTYELDMFLVGSVADASLYAKDVSIYIAGKSGDLFTEKSLAISTTLMEVGGRVTQPGQTIQNALISILGESFLGRYVGFDFSSDANAAVFGETIALGELGVYGDFYSSLPTVELAYGLPKDENLLVNATVSSGYEGAQLGTQMGGLDILTDGKLGVDEGSRWGGYFNNGDKLTWDLGATYPLYKFFVGSEYGMQEWVTKFKIYVSDSATNLYSNDNLIVDADHIGRDKLITLGNGCVNGRYIGFDFTGSCEPNGGNIRYFFRLGELGAYAMKSPEVTVSNAQNGIELIWSEAAGATGYSIYRSMDIISSWSEWELINDQKEVGFVDDTAVNGELYRYKVQGYRGKDLGEEVITSPIRCLKPCQVQVAKAGSAIQVSWSTNMAAASYMVYRQNEVADGWGEWQLIANTTQISLLDTQIESTTNYRYAVCSVFGDFTSAMAQSDSIRLELPAPTTTPTTKPTTTTVRTTTPTVKPTSTTIVKVPTTTKKTTTTTALKLATPKVTVSNATKGVKVSWGKISKADKYYVYRKTGSGSWSKIKTTTSVSYTDEGAKAGKSYQYMVKAVKGSVTSGYKAVSITRLTAPSTKVANAAKGVKVSWGKVTGASKYYVYRKTGSGSWSKIKTTTSTSYTDTKAAAGKSYQYMVKAVKGDYTSYYKAASIRFLKAPGSIKLTKATKGFKVSWSKVTGATKYEVYRRTGSGSYAKIATTTKTAYTDTKAAKGKYYTYRVRAVYSSYKSVFKTGSKVKR